MYSFERFPLSFRLLLSPFFPFSPFLPRLLSFRRPSERQQNVEFPRGYFTAKARPFGVFFSLCFLPGPRHFLRILVPHFLPYFINIRSTLGATRMYPFLNIRLYETQGVSGAHRKRYSTASPRNRRAALRAGLTRSSLAKSRQTTTMVPYPLPWSSSLDVWASINIGYS